MSPPRPRYPARRQPPDPRRMMVRLVMWGVPVIVSGMTLFYAHKILANRERRREPVAPPTANASERDGKPSSNLSAADVARLAAEISNREAERNKSNAQARELERLKREVKQLKERESDSEPAKKAEPEQAPAPEASQPDPEVERLKRELERLKAKAAQKPTPVPVPAPSPVAVAPKPEPAVGKPDPEHQPDAEAPKPEPSAEELRKKEEEARKLRELQALFEKASVYRKGREPEQLLKVLLELEKLRPKDPAVHLGLGEVYGSIGKHFDAQKARAEFQQFLDLTAVGQLNSESLHKFSFIKADDVDELRTRTRKHLNLLRKKHKLLLVTSRPRLAKLVDGLEKELKARKQAIQTHKGWIQTYESRIQRLRRSRRSDRNSQIRAAKRKIKTLEKAIEREEGQIMFVTDELAMIERETGFRRKNGH